MVGGDTRDRELLLVVGSLQKLAMRVESRFNPDMGEAAADDDSTTASDLVEFARACRAVLDDPGVSARLQAVTSHRW
ncbi:hypothetical protein [Mycolicibacterium lacusdiani]|uniref:hypothetical protein n=1 Tax=Mycolicibacterium lacusdiani TaxID=2895283 RepID=UPI001F16ABFC|nr:hypothetical protein [Mycolicibacterium lacusdiani]